MNRGKTRFAWKCDKFFWTVMLLLPILAYFFGNFHAAESANFLEYVNTWKFSFIADIIDSVLSTVNFGTFPLVGYLSYCVGVEILHCFYDFLVFIPRLAHKWVGKAVQDD